MPRKKFGNRRAKERGFSMVEMLVATVILVVSLVGVAQMIPLSIRLNAANRNDSTALVFAQRELDEMIDMPLTSTSFQDPLGVLCYPATATCNLGNSALPKTVVGSPVVMLNGRANIDFTAGTVANYNFTYTDPNDPFRAPYDVRWAVITFTNAATGQPTAKRFIVGVRKISGNTPLPPVTLETMKEL